MPGVFDSEGYLVSFGKLEAALYVAYVACVDVIVRNSTLMAGPLKNTPYATSAQGAFFVLRHAGAEGGIVIRRKLADKPRRVRQPLANPPTDLGLWGVFRGTSSSPGLVVSEAWQGVRSSHM